MALDPEAPTLLPALAALAGSLVGGAMSVFAVKVGKDKETSQRREDVARRAAVQRMKNLYEPLLRVMDPGPPYDDFYLDRPTCSTIIRVIEENERYASPDLLVLYWRFRREHFDVSGDTDQKTAVQLYKLALAEYAKLKELLGFGSIVKGDPWFRARLGVILPNLAYKWYAFNRRFRRFKSRFMRH